MKFIVYALFILMLAPCNNPKSISHTKTETDNSKVIIIYKKTACMGKCPVFTMTINGENKTIIYAGQYNVTKIGTYSKAISNDSLTKIVAIFGNAHFLEMEDKNIGYVPDLSTTIISYTNHGKSKTIEESAIKLTGLGDLKKLLDDIADSDGWKKVTPSN